MNLRKKKALAAKTFGVGKDRIVFSQNRLNEIKEAITKQDIRDLKRDGAISIKDVKGRRKVVKKKGRRGPGNVRKKTNKRKREYIILTRKLRGYVMDLKNRGEISTESFSNMRKKIRNKFFRSKSHLKEYLQTLK